MSEVKLNQKSDGTYTMKLNKSIFIRMRDDIQTDFRNCLYDDICHQLFDSPFTALRKNLFTPLGDLKHRIESELVLFSDETK